MFMRLRSVLRSLVFAVVAAGLAACPGSPHTELTVRVVSALTPGPEFNRIETDVFDVATGATLDHAEASAFYGQAYARGQIVAKFSRTPRTDLRVRVRAWTPAGKLLIAQEARLLLSADHTVTLFLDRDCIAVQCPSPGGSLALSACLAGQCADPRCDLTDPSTEQYCEDISVCHEASDCPAVPACATRNCVSGICVPAPIAAGEADACDETSYCDLTQGDAGQCTAVPVSTLPPPARDDCGEICIVGGNACAVGYWDCADAGPPVCTDFVFAPSGTSCASGGVCDGQGACAAPMDGGVSDASDAAVTDARMFDGGHTCGNGVIEATEVCDDNNTSDDDDCSADCTRQTCDVNTAPMLTSALSRTSCRTIRIAAGTYNGRFSANRVVTIIGAGPTQTILDAQSMGVALSLSGTTTNVSSLAVRNGRSTGDGAGIFMRSGTLTNVDIGSCVSTANGGGVQIRNGSTVTIRDSVIHDNSAQQGGGILVNNNANVDVINCTLRDNTATNGHGGAILVFDGTSNVTIQDTLLKQNYANGVGACGGAISVMGVALLHIEDSAFAGNETTSNAGTGGASDIACGGAIHSYNTPIEITNTEFEFNKATGVTALDSAGGSAISAAGYGGSTISVTIEGGSFRRNDVSSPNEANAGTLSVGNATLVVRDCEFVENTVQSPNAQGGAIDLNEGTLTVEDSVFERNELENGGMGAGIHAYTYGGPLAHTVSIERTRFIDNAIHAVSDATSPGVANGAGASLGTGTSSHIEDCVFTGNTISVDMTSATGTAAFSAAGLSARGNGSTVVSRTLIADNVVALTAPTMGSYVVGTGLLVSGAAPCVVRDTAMVRNETRIVSPRMGVRTDVSGGGLALGVSGPGYYIVNSTLGANDATLGATTFSASQFSYSGNAYLLNTTVADVSGASERGAMITGMNSLTVANSIIEARDNDGTACGSMLGFLTSAGHNVVSTGCLMTPLGTDVVTSDSTLTPSALLGPLTFDGDRAFYPLQATSPAIDHGFECSDEDAMPLTRDSRGVLYAGTCDSGSFEYIAP